MRYLGCRVAILSLVVVTAAASLMAQNGRLKPKPKPLATPPVVTGAEIISQSGDYVEPTTDPVEKTAAKPATTNAARIKELNDRLKKLEAAQGTSYDDRQKRVLMNLDILTRAEQRADSLQSRRDSRADVGAGRARRRRERQLLVRRPLHHHPDHARPPPHPPLQHRRGQPGRTARG